MTKAPYTIPEKINAYNVYKGGKKLIGISDEVTLPDFEAMTETISGAGVLGEIDSPAIGLFGSQEMEIPFRTHMEKPNSILAITTP